MMLDDEVEITLKDKNIAPLNLARLLRDIWQSELASPANCIYVAKMSYQWRNMAPYSWLHTHSQH